MVDVVSSERSAGCFMEIFFLKIWNFLALTSFWWSRRLTAEKVSPNLSNGQKPESSNPTKARVLIEWKINHPLPLPSSNIDSEGDTWHFCRGADTNPLSSSPLCWEITIGALGHRPSAPSHCAPGANLVDTNTAPDAANAVDGAKAECCDAANASQKENKPTDSGISCSLSVSLSRAPHVPWLSSCLSDRLVLLVHPSLASSLPICLALGLFCLYFFVCIFQFPQR